MGRHEQRYSDGAQWTEHVADGAATSVDPYTAPLPPPPAPPIPPPAAAPPASVAPGAPTPDATMPLSGGAETADPQHRPTAETPIAADPASSWPNYGQAPPTDTAPAAAWSSIDEPIAPDPTTTFPAPPVGQPAAAPGAFQSPPPYAAPPPGAAPSASPVEASGGTRWGLIALVALLVVGVVGAGAFLLTRSEDDGDGVADDPTTAIPEFGEDAALDNLARACQDGDWESCDDLYYQSAFDSGYEDYGDTCGGRNTARGDYCASLY